jgi:hypothetical protein
VELIEIGHRSFRFIDLTIAKISIFGKNQVILLEKKCKRARKGASFVTFSRLLRTAN